MAARPSLSRAHDPVGYELCRSVFKLKPEQDWHYSWLQPLPMVSAPPATRMFKSIDPWYRKFTWAREFTVLGHNASDEALLRANEIIRRLFAYRHDVLKSLIADGLTLVVLGPDEKISDLPEYKKRSDRSRIDPTARWLTYNPAMKVLVVDQENVLSSSGDNQVICVFADALYRVAGLRPVISNYRGDQQYELRVKRLDLEFDRTVTALFDKASSAHKWTGNHAARDKFTYWTTGVLAYFDAADPTIAPQDSRGPINTRETLEDYDPGLFNLVSKTMGYEDRVDWRDQARLK
jgi:hypothetical protein